MKKAAVGFLLKAAWQVGVLHEATWIVVGPELGPEPEAAMAVVGLELGSEFEVAWQPKSAPATKVA